MTAEDAETTIVTAVHNLTLSEDEKPENTPRITEVLRAGDREAQCRWCIAAELNHGVVGVRFVPILARGRYYRSGDDLRLVNVRPVLRGTDSHCFHPREN